MSCGVRWRCGSDHALLWLLHRLAAVTLIRPLAWEPPKAAGAALKSKKKKKKKTADRFVLPLFELFILELFSSFFLFKIPNYFYATRDIKEQYKSQNFSEKTFYLLIIFLFAIFFYHFYDLLSIVQMICTCSLLISVLIWTYKLYFCQSLPVFFHPIFLFIYKVDISF